MNRKEGADGDVGKDTMALNSFAAACLESAQKELTGTGGVKAVASFGYGLKGPSGEGSISLFAFTRQGTDQEEKEIEEVIRYARATSAEAVSVTMDLTHDPEVLSFFAGSDGVLFVAAASHDGTVGILRPYRRSEGRIVFGDPKITDNFSVPLLNDIFPPPSEGGH